MAIWKPFLLLVWVLPTTESFDPIYRYSFIGSKVAGPIYREFQARNLDECGRMAHRNKAIALTHTTNGTGEYCGLITKFVSIEENLDPFVHYYLLDKRITESKQCPSGRTVRQILKGLSQCEEEDKVCMELHKIKRHCDAVNVLNVDCHCPPHQKVIDDNGKDRCSAVITRKDGTEEYCPALHAVWKDKYGEFCCGKNSGSCCRRDTFCCRREERIEADGGKPYCCPDGTTFRGRHDGEAVCCPPEMDRVEGSRFCCPKGFVYSEAFKRCIGAIEFGEEMPENQKEMKRICTDVKSFPVKIENEEQNKALRSIIQPFGGIIGLHIPEGREWGRNNFRWSVDGSEPTFTKWAAGDPNNLFVGQAPEIFTLHKSDRNWIDVNYLWKVSHAYCMASGYDSRG